jgi:hypothetical protein
MSSEPLPTPRLPHQRVNTTYLFDRRFWLGAVISIACLYLAFRNIRWTELVAALRSVNVAILALAALSILGDVGLRSLRWRALLTPVSAVSAADAFDFLNIGVLANSVLPFRAGEFIRAILLGQKRDVSKSAVFATVVVERVFDILMLVILAVILMAAMPLHPAVRRTILFFGAAGLGMLALFWWASGSLAANETTWLSSWARKSIAWVAGSPDQSLQHGMRRVVSMLLRRIWGMMRSFSGGLGVLRSPRLAASAIGLTILAWGAALLYVWLVLRACGLDLPWTAALAVLVVVNFGAAIPASPGGLGVVHVLAMVALTPWDVPRTQALGFAIMVHAVLFLVGILLGLLSMWRQGMGLGQLAQTGDQDAVVLINGPANAVDETREFPV